MATTTQPMGPEDRAKRDQRWSVRVGVWLLGLAIVPLVGAVWLSTAEFHAIDGARDHVGAVHRTADELVLLTELRSRLLDERNWWSAVAGMEQVGIPPEAAEQLTGFDVVDELATTRTLVDGLLARLDLPEVDRALRALRADAPDDLETLGNDLLAIEGQVAMVSDGRLLHLADVAGDAGEAGDLNAALRLLENAADARQAVATQFSAYWSLLYSPSTDTQAEFERLLEQGHRRDAAVTVIAQEAPPDAAVRAVLIDMASSPDKRVFDAAVREAIDRTMAGGERPTDAGTAPDLTDILDDLDHVAANFNAGTAVTERHLDLVGAASADVVTATRVLDHHTDERVRRAITTVAVLILATLGFALAVAGLIGRPLRKLADSAARLSAGDTDVRAKPVGPTEVRQATAALNEAVDQLARAERQATALAEGRFDDPVLHEVAPGALGVSLQQAVRTLATSLSDREEFRRRLAHEARHDALTQVPNRRAVMHHLERSLARTRRTDTLLAVMFIDLDGFKAVNDLEGHPAGDAVLRAIATRLVTGVREGDEVGRLGGDEFLVVAEPVSGVEEAIGLAERLQATVCEPIHVDGTTLSVSASIGIAIVDAESTLTADEVLRDSDLAVYKAKASGRGCIALCDDRLRAELEERTDIEHALRRAIADDDLRVHYQPIVHPVTGALLALEALVRWQRAGHDLVAPDAFVPQAERSDLIVEVDRWVIDRVAQQLCDWECDEVLAGVPVAVNISGRHLARADFAESVLERLYRRGARPEHLIIEVTESALLHDLDRAAGRLQTLRDRGVRVSIDDFGTGYTSLAHLRTLPIDILKIDRSFTADTTAGSLVKLIIDTGHLLGARITAEGIETLEQAASLTQMGSDELQGFLYGRPVPADQLAALLTTPLH